MIRYTLRALIGYLSLSILLVLAGCVGRSAPPVNYFTLLSIDQLGENQVLAAHPEINLGIGPVSIPDRLKRSQIATSQHGNQYKFDEYNRWAGDLEENLAAVTGDNLSVLLGIKNLGYFPWMPHFKPRYQVVIDIQRLDGALDGEAVLVARWSVLDTAGKELLSGGRNVFQQRVKEPGYAGLVKTESLLVAELSRKVAEVIIQLIGRQGS